MEAFHGGPLATEITLDVSVCVRGAINVSWSFSQLQRPLQCLVLRDGTSDQGVLGEELFLPVKEANDLHRQWKLPWCEIKKPYNDKVPSSQRDPGALLLGELNCFFIS